MKESLRQAAGSLLVVGLGGTELTEMERAWLKLIGPAGIILFRRNIVDAAQTRALLSEATSFCPPHYGAFVDVEGGTVDRLRDVLAPIPSVQAVAQAARATGRAALQREHGELVARAVKAFGFNASFAPVLDLALPESRKVMATRCASETGAGVVVYAREFLAGLAAQGQTDIIGLEYIDRGYERLEEMLGALGADVSRATGIAHASEPTGNYETTAYPKVV